MTQTRPYTARTSWLPPELLLPPPPPPPTRRRGRWLLVALLGGLLLFAHLGCHGDEDNELFAVTRVKMTR